MSSPPSFRWVTTRNLGHDSDWKRKVKQIWAQLKLGVASEDKTLMLFLRTAFETRSPQKAPACLINHTQKAFSQPIAPLPQFLFTQTISKQQKKKSVWRSVMFTIITDTIWWTCNFILFANKSKAHVEEKLSFIAFNERRRTGFSVAQCFHSRMDVDESRAKCHSRRFENIASVDKKWIEELLQEAFQREIQRLRSHHHGKTSRLPHAKMKFRSRCT